MYKKIHPYFYNQIKNGFEPCEEKIIRLDSIRIMEKQCVPDGSIDLVRLHVSDDHLEDILIPQEEADSIKQDLLSEKKENPVADELSRLTTAIRELKELLRARL